MSASKIQLKGRRRGFTLIEILIVVVILGILAAIVIPQFTSASDQAAVSSVRSQLQTLRSQVHLYQVQTGEDPSGFEDLVPKYLQRMPEAPKDWEFVLGEDGSVTANWTGAENAAPEGYENW